MVIGILRCRYLGKCGPDVREFETQIEREEAEKLCLTRRHYGCVDYQRMQKEEQTRREVIKSSVEDRY